MEIHDKRFLFSGYARLPAGTASNEVYKVMALVVIIDMNTGVIMEADCTLSTPTSALFVARILVGNSLRDGVNDLVKRIDAVYQGSAKKSIITALKIVYDKYMAVVRSKNDVLP